MQGKIEVEMIDAQKHIRPQPQGIQIPSQKAMITSMQRINQPQNIDESKQFQSKKEKPKESAQQVYSKEYMYSIPKLDDKQLQQLLKLQLGDNKYLKRLIKGTFISIILAQISIFILYLLNYLVAGLPQRISVVCVQCLMGIISILWSLITYRPKGVFTQHAKWFIHLISFSSLAFIGGAISAFVQLWYVLLIVWFISALSCFIMNMKHERNIIINFSGSTIFTLSGGLSGFLMHLSVCPIESASGLILGCISVTLFGLFFIMTIICAIYQILIKKQQDHTAHYAIVIFLYFISLGLTFSISGIINKQNIWVYISQVINVAFIIVCVFYIWNFVLVQNKKVYQISRSLLTTDKNHPSLLKNQNSKQQKPLNACLICLSQQSRFYYQNCMHVCCGYGCIVSYIKNKQAACPMCRKQSDALIQIQRVKPGEFKILSMYRIK